MPHSITDEFKDLYYEPIPNAKYSQEESDYFY